MPRKMPLYLLLDTSDSMSGEPIEAVKQGVHALLAEFRGDPQALETLYLSVITFDTDARQVCPLTDLMSFTPPDLVASGDISGLGTAIDVLTESIGREVDDGTEDIKGDWEPIVLVFTGSADGDWRPAFRRLAALPGTTFVLTPNAGLEKIAHDEGLVAATPQDSAPLVCAFWQSFWASG